MSESNDRFSGSIVPDATAGAIPMIPTGHVLVLVGADGRKRHYPLPPEHLGSTARMLENPDSPATQRLLAALWDESDEAIGEGL